MTVAAETCANCGQEIGRLETPHLWQNQVVCARCHARLAPPVVAYAEPRDSSDDYREPMDYRDPVVIEQTAKRYKGMQAGGAIALIFGIALLIYGAASQADAAYGFGMFGAIGGTVFYIMGRIAGWWNHG